MPLKMETENLKEFDVEESDPVKFSIS